MSRLVIALLLAAGAVRAAGAQATPATALRVKERAQRTANAASARNRAQGAPEAQPAAQPAAPAAQPGPSRPSAIANKPSVAAPPAGDAPVTKTDAPAGRRPRATRPDTAVAAAVPSADSPSRARAADAPAAAGRADTTVDVSRRGAKGQLSFRREVYAYDGGGRRDPFVSLLANGELRPDIGSLRIATILHDPTGRNSIAILRDDETKEQYRARVGQTLGRMRVTRIEPKQVTFIIDEFGFSRQEVLTLEKTNERTP